MNIYVHIKYAFVLYVESATGPLLSSENSLKLFSFFYGLGHETLNSSGRQLWRKQMERSRSKKSPHMSCSLWGWVDISAPSSCFIPACVGVLEKTLLCKGLVPHVPCRGVRGFWWKWSGHSPALGLSSAFIQQRHVWPWSYKIPAPRLVSNSEKSQSLDVLHPQLSQMAFCLSCFGWKHWFLNNIAFSHNTIHELYYHYIIEWYISGTIF